MSNTRFPGLLPRLAKSELLGMEPRNLHICQVPLMQLKLKNYFLKEESGCRRGCTERPSPETDKGTLLIPWSYTPGKHLKVSRGFHKFVLFLFWVVTIFWLQSRKLFQLSPAFAGSKLRGAAMGETGGWAYGAGACSAPETITCSEKDNHGLS